MHRWHWKLACLAFSLLGLACAREERPDLLLITLDTTRADRIGTFGDETARTPVLDALADAGVAFERAYASAPRTLPSHLTMLSGLDPHEHGVHDNGVLLPDDLETAAQRLSGAGYATAAFVSAFVLNTNFGLSRGFDVYDDEIDARGSALDFSVPQRPGSEVTDRALEWLGAQHASPYFVWVHYYDPHRPHTSPEADDPYADEIATMDEQIGRLIAAARSQSGDDRLVVLAVGDHGEALGEHEEATHGILAYDATLHVPLIAAGPGFPAGTRVRAFVQTRDISPTLLAAAGEPALPSGGAVALQQALAEPATPRPGYFESVGPELNYGWARIGGVREGRWKFTAEPAPTELYDVEADPREQRNRAADEPELTNRLAEIYAALRDREREASPVDVSPDVRAQLAALGYASAPMRLEGDAPDPRKLVPALEWIDRARSVARDGRVGDAIRALEALSTHPALQAVGLTNLAAAYGAAGRTADAVDAYGKLAAMSDGGAYRLGLAQALLSDGRPEEALAALDVAPADDTRRHTLVRARSLVALGRVEEALPALEDLLHTDPGDDPARAIRAAARAQRDGGLPEVERLSLELASEPEAGAWSETRLVLADLLSGEGRAAEAVEVLAAGAEDPRLFAARAEIAARHGNFERAAGLYEQALRVLPYEHSWLLELADAYRELGRDDDAVLAYEVLLSADPGLAAVHVDRAVVLYKVGRHDEAEAGFRIAAELDPEIAEAWFNLALSNLRNGDPEAAEEHLRRAVAVRADYAKAHFHLAQLYRERGDPRAAEHAELAVQAGGSL